MCRILLKRAWEVAGTQMPEEVCTGAMFMLPGEGKMGGGQHNA